MWFYLESMCVLFQLLVNLGNRNRWQRLLCAAAVALQRINDLIIRVVGVETVKNREAMLFLHYHQHNSLVYSYTCLKLWLTFSSETLLSLLSEKKDQICG